MKWLSVPVLVTTIAAVLATAASNPQLAEVHSVYILPMSGNLDQFLAVRLTAGNVFLVVTDPKRADAIFTERIGAGFEDALNELYKDPKKEAESKDDKDKLTDNFARPTMKPLSNGKGSLFLVDRKTKNVIWSTYEKPKSNRSDDVNQLAQKIASRLEKDLRAK